MPFRRGLATVLLLALPALGCADFHRGPAAPDGGQGSDAALVVDFTFETQVYPLLQMDCQQCHAVGREARGSQLLLSGNARLDRAMVVALVDPGVPDQSLLLIRATGESHPGGTAIAPETDAYVTIADWIAQLPTP